MKEHRALTPRQEALAERALFGAILTLRSVEECRAFFRDLCTPAELQALADRWAVVGLLQQGVPYREIYRQTGVSVTTIGRVAREPRTKVRMTKAWDALRAPRRLRLPRPPSRRPATVRERPVALRGAKLGAG